VKRVYVLIFLICASVSWSQVEYQPITGELLEHWNTAVSCYFSDTYNYESGKLPDGIQELCITCIEFDRDSLNIYLLGIDVETDIPFLLATGEYGGAYNFSKSVASYDEDSDEIHLYFQMPFSEVSRTGCYRWDIEEKALVLLRYETSDPSQNELERVNSLLSDGDIEEAIDELNNMLYPGNYFSSDEMLARLLRSINRIALEEQNENCYQRAVALFMNLPGFLFTGDEWYTAFDDSLDYMESCYSSYMDLSEYVMIINNYAFFLEQTDDLYQSLFVLRRVLDIEPSRMVAHLNIADVLWTLGEAAEAKEYYNVYLEMMTDNELTHQIPVRVHERIAMH